MEDTFDTVCEPTEDYGRRAAMDYLRHHPERASLAAILHEIDTGEPIDLTVDSTLDHVCALYNDVPTDFSAPFWRGFRKAIAQVADASRVTL